jgi:mono/diheme cytochrome c family protein
MMKKIYQFTFVGLGLLIGCTAKQESDLLAPPDPVNSVTSYTNHVKTIIESNCINCHGSSSPSAGLPLTSYSEVKSAVQNNNLISRISLDSGSPGVMPTSGKMPQNLIDQIIKWQDEGFLE